MAIERIVRIFAGSLIVGSLALGRWFSGYWLLVTLFVGANLFQSGITRWCLLENFLKKAGFKSCCELTMEAASNRPETKVEKHS